MTETKWTMHFEDERDMRLAVHAPELLEVLKIALRPVWHLVEEGDEAAKDIYSDMREAIAKAEGNAP